MKKFRTRQAHGYSCYKQKEPGTKLNLPIAWKKNRRRSCWCESRKESSLLPQGVRATGHLFRGGVHRAPHCLLWRGVFPPAATGRARAEPPLHTSPTCPTAPALPLALPECSQHILLPRHRQANGMPPAPRNFCFQKPSYSESIIKLQLY